MTPKLTFIDSQDEEWLIPAGDFSTQQQPIAWLVKHWIQSNALIMVHGPSGGGKTFVVMDMALRMASRRADGEHTVREWLGGAAVKPGAVVYLVGEGHQGMRSRIAAWKQHHGVQMLDAWVSESGCDLNTHGGYQKVRHSILGLPVRPDLIVVDTLHRFLVGDENSAQDAKTMLDTCAKLMEQFSCSVLLVHHTGVSEEAQHRARGSSAWRGALDIEISVTPRGDGKISIVQKKSKDAELAKPVWAELDKVKIDGWNDEDGQPVTSAVLVGADGPAKADKVDAKLAKHKTSIGEAWVFGGERRTEDGEAYITKASVEAYLVEHCGKNVSTARQYMKPGNEGRLIYSLTVAGVIQDKGDGWVIPDKDLISQANLNAGNKGNK